MVDGPLLRGDRCVERSKLENAAADAFYLGYSPIEISEIMFAIDLTDKREGGRWPAPTGRPIRHKG